jgi:protease-4
MSENKKISFGRIFWPSLWAALIVSVLGLVIWVIVIGSFISSFDTQEKRVKNNTILHMTLDGVVSEKGQSDLDPTTFTIQHALSVSAILHGFEAAKTDDKIKGVFLEIDNLQCGLAGAKEIRDAINDFEESGKFVVAHNSGEVVSTGEYYIASAADETYGFPTSSVQFLGLGAELAFFKGTLDKLDVEMQVVRGKNNDFKSAVEPFFRENMSDSARVQAERYLTSIWMDMRKDISKDRKISVKELDRIAEEALVTDVESAVKHKLMDKSKYRDEVLAILAKKVGNKKDDKLQLFSFNKYARKKFRQDQTLVKADDPNIAVIVAEGGVAKSGEGLTSDQICKLFKKARENKSIKTVVFRINSPGGSALASEEIWREVKLTNDKKKVVVSMGDIAASGGYYIASPGSYIFAEPTTITGSIGVFGVIPYTGAMMENKLGISFDRVSTNSHSILTTNKKLSEEEFSIIQDGVDEIYELFLQRVADGRGMTKNEVNVVARGRVWTGTDAKNIGLVDELGGLYDAIDYAAKKAGIKDQKVLYYPEKKEDKLEAILEQLDEGSSMKIKGTELPKTLLKSYEKIKTLESYQGMQMRLPFEIEFK